MKRDPEFFEDKDPQLVYIGRRLRDALQIENLFTAAGIDYGVEADTYQGGVVFRSAKVGAFFYVLPADDERARAILLDNGFRPLTEKEY